MKKILEEKLSLTSEVDTLPRGRGSRGAAGPAVRWVEVGQVLSTARDAMSLSAIYT